MEGTRYSSTWSKLYSLKPPSQDSNTCNTVPFLDQVSFLGWDAVKTRSDGALLAAVLSDFSLLVDTEMDL